METKEQLAAQNHEEQDDPIMKLSGKVTKVGPKTYRWEPAETLEIDASNWHPQASK
jgi:hypothetical protein